MNGFLIFCTDCNVAVEGVLLVSDIRSYRATQWFADDHYTRYQHWPLRCAIRPADPAALRLVGARR